ncbi:hypothetical protein GCM10023149_24320 [Mucilaginibacter gynuensis]|uniref:DUF4302 domain-containing protein n=1 Tax=Mucilaginibacter gynuensis TaxID=1302236 RepID=A0ABP8GFH6_9SPHI
MKKYIIYTLLSVGLLASCKKGVDPAPGERPEERTEAKLKEYNDALTGSTNGWVAYLYPDGGSGFSFYMKFSTNNRVTMLADISEQSTQDVHESSYRLKSVLAPSLLFDTYNYMHILADPAPEVNGGVAGWGLYSDFEFSFDKVSGDTITLRGNLLDSKLILIKATAAQAESYNNKGLNTLVNDILGYTAENQYLFVNLGDATQVQATINASNKIFTLNWLKDNVISTSSSAFAFTLTGIVLKEPVEYEGKQITELTWDAANKQLYTTVGGEKVIVQVSPTPILPLHLLIGVSYSNIIVPYASSYPGWSADFVSRRAAAAATMLAGPYGLRLDRMQFQFDVLSSRLTITADIYQGGNKFLADFPYTYSKTADGIYKFTAGNLSGNASLIRDNMAPLTTQRLSVDTFTLDYFFDSASGQVLGQFKSVEHPEFTFSGTLN